MKRTAIILTLLLAAAAQLNAQHYIGLRGGYGGADVRVYPSWDTPVYWGTFSSGAAWKYYSSERNLGGVEIDLEYMQRGFQYISFSDDNITYRRTVNSLMLPIFWQPHAYMFDRRMRMFLNLGVTFSYNLSSKEHYIDNTTGTKTTSDYEMKLVRDNRWGYGLCGGLGISYAVGRTELFAEGRYYFGYSDILKRKTVYEDNEFQRSPLDNFEISAGVFFRLGRGDDSPRSGQRRLRRNAEAELNATIDELTSQNR